MKQKILVFVLCIATVFSLVGCSNNTNESIVEGTETSGSETEVVPEFDEAYNKEMVEPFPEKIAYDNSKYVTIDNSINFNGSFVNIVLSMGQKDSDSYIDFKVKDVFDFKILTKENNQYTYIDVYSYIVSTMTTDELENLKKTYAEELGISASEITSEQIDEYIRKKTLLCGYTDLSLDSTENESINAETIELLQSSYLDMEQINTILSAYSKDKLVYDTTENGLMKATYKVEGYESPIKISVDENTKELVDFSFSYKEDDVEYNTIISLKNFDMSSIDSSWATMDSPNKNEDIYELFNAVLSVAFTSFVE